jgi:hypothetical protein
MLSCRAPSIRSPQHASLIVASLRFYAASGARLVMIPGLKSQAEVDLHVHGAMSKIETRMAAWYVRR